MNVCVCVYTSAIYAVRETFVVTDRTVKYSQHCCLHPEDKNDKSIISTTFPRSFIYHYYNYEYYSYCVRYNNMIDVSRTK